MDIMINHNNNEPAYYYQSMVLPFLETLFWENQRE